MSGRPRGCPGVFGNPPGCPGGLPYVQERSKGYLECMGMVRRPSRMFVSGRLALPDVREWSGVSPRCLWWLGGPHRCTGVVGSLSWLSGSGWEALPDVREWSGISAKGPGVVGRPSRMSGSGQKALSDVREWLGVPP